MRCEDFPCCGHEAGDCDGSLYGTDESIKAEAAKHFGCEHEHGYCVLDEEDFEPEYASLSDWEYEQGYLSGSGEHNSDSYINYLNNH